MANKILKKQLIEVVENQLRMNEPKCTKETLERLMSSGIGRIQAKEMIAAVLLEEMYDVLKNNEPFNEERYVQKLSGLKVGSIKALNEYKNYSMHELFKQIEYNDGNFPGEILQEIIERKNEAIPCLLDILKKVLENPQIINDDNYFAHIYSVYLLAQFRVKEAYPIFVEILKLPGEQPHFLFGDTICEAGSRILASVCGNELGPIKALIISDKADEFVRAQAVEALAILALQGLRSRDEIIEYYRRLLTGAIPDKNTVVMAEVVSCSNNLYPKELIDEIRLAFKKGLVDESIIDLNFVKSTLTLGMKDTLDMYKSDIHHQLINDTIDELKDWVCFNEDFYFDEDFTDVTLFGDEEIITQPIVKGVKIGRNEYCPCGSGKKYKKCCGK